MDMENAEERNQDRITEWIEKNGFSRGMRVGASQRDKEINGMTNTRCIQNFLEAKWENKGSF